MTEVEARFSNGLAGDDLNIFLALYSNGKKWWFLFDSGNIVDMKISKAIVPYWKAGLTKDTTVITFTYNFAGNPKESKMYIDDIIYDGALDFAFLSSRHFALSLKNQKLFTNNQ